MCGHDIVILSLSYIPGFIEIRLGVSEPQGRNLPFPIILAIGFYHSLLYLQAVMKLRPDTNRITDGLMLTDPVSENYDEEDEDERILPVTMVTASAAKTATADAVHYAVATTTSTRPHHRDLAVVEIDLLEQGNSFGI